MNATAPEARPWSRGKWWGMVGGLFLLQVLLLLGFGSRGPVPRRPVPPATQLELAGDAARELVMLSDPTLFAQGNPRGFSGASWMKIPVPEYQPPEWSEAPRLLALNARQLGADFRRFMQTNRPSPPAFTAKPQPQFTAPEIGETASATSAPSTLRVEGELAARRMQATPKLPAWEAADLLTNSVVQVLVNGDGNVISEVLLAPSGKPEADAQALAIAKAGRFEPLPRTNRGRSFATPLVWGVLIFEWQTVPLSATNARPAGP